MPGHSQPFFAPIAALIGLSAPPGLRGRQAIQVVAGVVLGVGIGAAVITISGRGTLQLTLAVAVALALCTAFGAHPIVSVQAAASAILVVALHRNGQNLGAQRLVDALIGGGIAILLARYLFPVDPLALVRREFERLRSGLADALDLVAAALRGGDRDRAQQALAHLDGIDVRRLFDALALAHEVTLRAPRRHGARRRIERLNDVAAALRAAAGDARGLVTGALRAIDTEGRPAPGAADAVDLLASAFRTRDSAAIRDAAQRARSLAQAALERDGSLGLGVLVHAVNSIADDLEGSAQARDEAERVPVTGMTRLPFSRQQ